MGLYIKGLPPLAKDDCKAYTRICIANVYQGNGEIKMYAYNDYTDEFIGEVIEVPPHGRLVDVEYLKEHLFQCETNGRPLHTMDLTEIIACIDDVPTVIEAEGEV